MIPIILKRKDSRYKQTWWRKCSCDNHDPDDNPKTDTVLILEYNEKHKIFIDRRPEYYCHECNVTETDYIE